MRTDEGGFTLIEVLVAVIIIAIVAIPILKAFVTSANTTAKSKMKMRATNAAENIMEDLEALSVEQAVRKYGLGLITGPNADGLNTAAAKYVGEAYSIPIYSENDAFDKDLNDAIKAGYQAEIFIDPTFYSYSNGVNVSNFDILSSDIAAIYSMSPELDAKAYKEYYKRHEEYCNDNGLSISVTPDKFEEKLYREIRVDIEKKGMITNAKEESYPKVTVTVSVFYLLNESGIVNDGDEEYKALERQIFSNSVSEKELSSIFIMYYPAYEMAGKGGDIITVHNHDDIEADLYVVAQNVDANADKFEKYRKSATGGLILSVYEDEITDEDTGKKRQPLILRTNLVDNSLIEYVRDDTLSDDQHLIPVQCFLKAFKSSADKTSIGDPFTASLLSSLKSSKGSFGDTKMTTAFSAGALDGKTLDASTIENRIYDVTVTVWKPSDAYKGQSYAAYTASIATDSSAEWPVTVELTGSMLQKGER